MDIGDENNYKNNSHDIDLLLYRIKVDQVKKEVKVNTTMDKEITLMPIIHRHPLVIKVNRARLVVPINMEITHLHLLVLTSRLWRVSMATEMATDRNRQRVMPVETVRASMNMDTNGNRLVKRKDWNGNDNMVAVKYRQDTMLAIRLPPHPS